MWDHWPALLPPLPLFLPPLHMVVFDCLFFVHATVQAIIGMNIFGNIKFQVRRTDGSAQMFLAACPCLFLSVTLRYLAPDLCCSHPWFTFIPPVPLAPPLQGSINRDANFQDFPTAMFTLFRMTTGENWNQLMVDSMVMEDCIVVEASYNFTLTAGANATLIWAGTYLDPVRDAVTISALPSSIKVRMVRQLCFGQRQRRHLLLGVVCICGQYVPISPSSTFVLPGERVQSSSMAGRIVLLQLHDRVCIPPGATGHRGDHREYRDAENGRGDGRFK